MIKSGLQPENLVINSSNFDVSFMVPLYKIRSHFVYRLNIFGSHFWIQHRSIGQISYGIPVFSLSKNPDNYNR